MKRCNNMPLGILLTAFGVGILLGGLLPVWLLVITLAVCIIIMGICFCKYYF